MAIMYIPICDAKQTGMLSGYGVDRHLTAEEMLRSATNSFPLNDAFLVVKTVHRTTQGWETKFSMVYSYHQNKVYYCYDHNFDDIKE